MIVKCIKHCKKEIDSGFTRVRVRYFQYTSTIFSFIVVIAAPLTKIRELDKRSPTDDSPTDDSPIPQLPYRRFPYRQFPY